MLSSLLFIFAVLDRSIVSSEVTTNNTTSHQADATFYNATEKWIAEYEPREGKFFERAFPMEDVTNYQQGLNILKRIFVFSPCVYEQPKKSWSPKSSVVVEQPAISICCESGWYYGGSGKCYENAKYPAEPLVFPKIYNSSLAPSAKRPEDFGRRYGYPCANESYAVNEGPPAYDVFHLLENGTIVQPNDPEYHQLESNEYCLATVMIKNRTEHVVLVCFRDIGSEMDRKVDYVIYPATMLFSTIFLVATFLVYSLVPELKTMHGLTLRCYLGCLIVSYAGLSTTQLIGTAFIDDHPILCKLFAFIIYFSFLSSFFWLNVMCFDIWWTFGGFRSIQGTVKQREKKKFIMYSIYAWGSATLLTGICIIMEFVPGIPDSFIRPKFGTNSCWFISETAKALYFYGPMGITVTCNICLFISTTMKIIQHKKDTAHHLKGMDSQRHDDNKQWFNLYLKLFVVMGINWSMEIISWAFKDSPQYVWYLTDLMNTLQGVIIFIIFVWKNKTKRLLLKRLGCQNNSFQSRTSTRSGYLSSTSRTVTATAVMAPLQEKINPYTERNKTIADESDRV